MDPVERQGVKRSQISIPETVTVLSQSQAESMLNVWYLWSILCLASG